MMGDMGGMTGWGWMGSGMGLSVLLGLGVHVLVALGIIAGIRRLIHGSTGSASPVRSDGALERLRKRDTRGEVSRDEFERMHGDLTAGTGMRR